MNRLKEIRNGAGMTQEELADRLHLKRSVISKYENGVVPLTDALIVLITKLFGVSADYLLGRSDEPAPNAAATNDDEIKMGDFEYALFGEVRELGDEDKAELLRNARRMRELIRLRNAQGK